MPNDPNTLPTPIQRLHQFQLPSHMLHPASLGGLTVANFGIATQAHQPKVEPPE
ncbi:uncharacterized protein FIBRA_09361 [Fibroporia radiculosa]|uniref:Uncharacterized protein n=1 Tax=Fibroporia radiculosa TaxID=599839 RepID=J7SCB8_9APHY|nr:uncharacterized protein FIBRA_09361 [Fibroporia radiculosa]CCM07041.1 predicted protein [Fibroporia radiculosa]